MKRRLLSVLAISGLLALSGTIVSCGGSEEPPVDTEKPNPQPNPDPTPNPDPQPNPDPVNKEFIMEAEYTDLSKKLGAGISGSAGGKNMAIEHADASNGYAVSYLHTEGVSVDFEFTATKAAEATLTLTLGNELSAMEFKPGIYDIEFNGTKITYNKFIVSAKPQIGLEFKDYKISKKLNLVEGLNTIKLITGVNEYCNGGSGGPIVDCVKLTTTAECSYTPIEDNIL